MSFISLPAELQLMMITLLPTRDIVVLGHTCRHLRAIAEDERAKRQDINRLLKRYVDDTDGFRRLMRDTGGIIVGEFAKAFFTGEDMPKTMELLFAPQESQDIDHSQNLWSCWFIRDYSSWLSLERLNHNLLWIEEVSRDETIANLRQI
jgi:hypothetical protein